VLQALGEPPRFLPETGVWMFKASVASGLAWWVGNLIGEPRPYFAVLAVIIAMQGHTYGSLLKAAQFLLGVFGGLVLGVLALRSPALPPPVLTPLWDALRATMDALDQRLAGARPEEALDRARAVRKAFLRRRDGDAMAAAIAVELKEMAADRKGPRLVEEGEDRPAIARVLGVLRGG
jgi:hypothetical protein